MNGSVLNHPFALFYLLFLKPKEEGEIMKNIRNRGIEAGRANRTILLNTFIRKSESGEIGEGEHQK